MRKTALATLAIAVLSAGAFAAPLAPAQASTACSATSIRINATAGAENPTTVSGHSHQTGKHYVSTMKNRVWYWYADNDNGKSDKWDTYFGMQQC